MQRLLTVYVGVNHFRKIRTQLSAGAELRLRYNSKIIVIPKRMRIYARDLFEMAWPAIINSWLGICSGVGITSQARHFIYTPGQILNHAVDYTLDIIGVEDTEDDTVVLTKALATHALNELLRCFHYTMLNEFEGKDHVKRKMSNYTEFKVNKRKYPTDFANAIDFITSIDDDEIHTIIRDACTAAARAEICTYQCAYYWRVLRLAVKLRPYALHWLEDYAKRICKPGGGDYQEGLAFINRSAFVCERL